MSLTAIGLGIVVTSCVSLYRELRKNPSKPYYDRVFIDVCKKMRIGIRSGKTMLYPRIKTYEPMEWGVRLSVALPIGLSSERIIKHKQTFAEAFKLDDNSLLMAFNQELILSVITAVFPSLIPYRANERTDYQVLIGYNQMGDSVYYDFAGKYPHLLVAGISGGGKSVLVRNIITQLVTGATPDLHLCDLKGGVELGLFKELACVKSFCTELHDIYVTVTMLEKEMKRRYSIMSDKGIQEWVGKRSIMVIDELADFKSRTGDPQAKLKNEIKGVITRISAKGRASGIILLLATQRPSVDIVDGVIKTNIASSICFRTRDNVQSRIVLDHGGAADLPNIPGRFIYQTSEEVVLQAPFISVKEVKSIISTLPKKEVKKDVDQQPHTSEVGTLEGNSIEL